MFSKIFRKVPAALIVVPMLFAAFINSFWPKFFNMGPTSSSIASVDGLNAIISITLVAVGSQLTLSRLKKALSRGLILFISKWVSSIALGFIFIKLFGNKGIFGISSLCFIAAISNQNNSIFVGLINDYGDEYDMASAAITSIISVPIFTFLTLSILKVADITPSSILDLALPILVGIFLGNIDKDFCKFLGQSQKYILVFLGFSIGASINLSTIIEGGLGGIILSILTVLSAFLFTVPADILINKRPGWAGISIYTAAGNAIIVPALVSDLDKSWQATRAISQAQLGTVVIFTSILVPIVVGLWNKKFGVEKIKI